LRTVRAQGGGTNQGSADRPTALLRNGGDGAQAHGVSPQQDAAAGSPKKLASDLKWQVSQPPQESAMKFALAALAAALVSAASVGTVGVFHGLDSEKEVAVTMPVSLEKARSLVPFIEKAARERGIKRVRAYDRDVFIPLDQAMLSFVRNGDSLSMHVEVESEYRYAKGDRAAALADLKTTGASIFARALELQAQSNG
jgi:hypothetical protein